MYVIKINKCPYLTLDKQLLAFCNRCLFKMYIRKKPAKYDIKFVLMCDIDSKYMITVESYIGKGSIIHKKGGGTLPVAPYYVNKLTAPTLI